VKKYEVWVVSNGEKLVPHFVEAGQLVQELKGDAHIQTSL